MELNLAVSSVRITTCREQPPSVEGVQLRETRSSYFLNIQLQGLRKEDIQLEMDKDRCLLIRGEKYLQDIMGTLRWKWRVVAESGTPTKPFKIPEDVNVGGIRVSFERGLLHISMPKLTRNTFAPYHVFHIHSSHLPDRPHHHQPNRQQQEEEAANNMADHKLATISEETEVKMEPLSLGHPDEEEEEGKMSAEVPTRECTAPPSDSVQAAEDSTRKEACVSQTEIQHEDVMQERGGDAEETIGKGIEGEESPHAADAEAKQGAVVQEEKEGYYEKVKEERDIMGNGYVESEISERPKPFLCQGISQMFSAIAAIAHRKRGRG